MLPRWIAVLSIGLATGCARKHPRIYDPVPPPDTTADATAPATTTTETPAAAVQPPAPAAEPAKLPASLIVYSQFHYKDKSLLTSGPVRGVSPDAPTTELTLVDGNSRDVLVTNHLVAGVGEESRQHWIMNIKSAAIASVPSLDALTSDDRIVARCKGGVGEDFELCTFDASGGNKRVVFHDKAVPDDAATVAGAGGTRVLVRYASNSRPPFAYDLTTEKRQDLPGLAKKSKSVERSIISPSGNLAARCYLSNAKATLVIADLAGGAPDRTIAVGDLLRCDCKFSPDDKTIACGVLQNEKKWLSKPDRLLAIDLGTGKQTYLNDSITGFVFSPDGRNVAHLSPPSGGKGLALDVTPASGGSTRELAPWSVDKPLVGWIAP